MFNWVGHNNIKHVFNKMLMEKKLSGSMIFYGTKGIGKFSVALHLSKLLLSNPIVNITDLNSITMDAKVANLVNKNSHPNFLLIQPEFDDKKNVYKENISIEDVRKISKFLQSQDDTHYKIILVDALDNLNISASNGILKNLEEPPANVLFLLISHNYGSLLDTITSRCIALKFHNLKDSEILTILQQQQVDISSKQQKDILQLAGGSYAKALWYLNPENLSFYKGLEQALLAHNKQVIMQFSKDFQKILVGDLESFFNMLGFLIIKHSAKYNFSEIYDFYQNLSTTYYKLKVFNLDKMAVLTTILYKLHNMKIDPHKD